MKYWEKSGKRRLYFTNAKKAGGYAVGASVIESFIDLDTMNSDSKCRVSGMAKGMKRQAEIFLADCR